ncbi:hypothetical protein [Neoroseomonas oryzicola]|uniref:Tyr recombinase domain-containing protein n=1 Tax=Neoroseomonas oryzicola TaxID=535904 RepID=A0A9X9WPC7_9PROT|nr:hypothetical protein [Neoroseomonas oryzicola]MBR0662187.1 hypothetical protein [Neoroseomonas oryzicola]NKE17807.1 hypothetical protein [Neoroseomonas oryzicola]
MTRARVWSLGLADWPAEDRAAWEGAFSAADSPFDENGASLELGDFARRKIREAYGVWLHYLRRRGELDPLASPAARATRARLDSWIADQRGRGNRGTTIHGRLRDLQRCLALIDPAADVGFILQPGGRSLRRLLKPKPRWCEVRDSRELLARALDLFRAGCEGRGYARGRVAVRDAALLGLLAAHGPRIRSVSAMEIGENIVRTEAGYRLHFGEKDTKTKVFMSYDMHPELVPVFDRYLSDVRPSLPGSAFSAAVWIGTRGRALSALDLGKVVRRRTKAWFGREEGPHWFRKCLRTTASMISPELALDAGAALGHDPQVSIDHYLKSRGTEALRRHGVRIAGLRKETWSLAASHYGWRGRAKGAARQTRRKAP